MDFSPVKLAPAYKDYLWGGEKLKKLFNKDTDITPLAESWELSVHKDGESVVCGGEFDGLTLSQYLEKLGKAALGENSSDFERFPMLIKFIDAKSDLSVQVHPSDEYALAHEGEYGKTEMWYILDCDEGAFLYYGFSRDIDRDEYERAIREERLTELLNRVEVKRGDVFFIPAGTVHAIGAGIVICEIQQNSNTTYRVYDYGRRDKNGNLRQLHVEKALEVSDLKKSPVRATVEDGDDVLLSSCEYFTVRRLRINGNGKILLDGKSFASVIVTSGEGSLEIGNKKIDFSCGESIFFPAQKGCIDVYGSCELILSYVD